jgi:hypothetical protein
MLALQLELGGSAAVRCKATPSRTYSSYSTVRFGACLFVFISSTMRSSGHGLGASSPLITTPQYQR